MIRRLLEHSRWFVRESRGYIGPYTWRDRLHFPGAWLRFLWYSRREILRGSA